MLSDAHAFHVKPARPRAGHAEGGLPAAGQAHERLSGPLLRAAGPGRGRLGSERLAAPPGSHCTFRKQVPAGSIDFRLRSRDYGSPLRAAGDRGALPSAGWQGDVAVKSPRLDFQISTVKSRVGSCALCRQSPREPGVSRTPRIAPSAGPGGFF